MPQDRRSDAYGFVRSQVQEGRQAFVVCPLIEESSSIEAKAATEEYERLSGEIFPDLRVGLLHGRMSSRDKDATLRQFGEGGLDVLVTTAVVEVGIDVPNATIMLIEGAERFGLAQLHQFRGRVGRGEHRSYCLLLSSDTQSASAKERLAALERTNDGFELAEIDPGTTRAWGLLRHAPERVACPADGPVFRPCPAGIGQGVGGSNNRGGPGHAGTQNIRLWQPRWPVSLDASRPVVIDRWRGELPCRSTRRRCRQGHQRVDR